MINSVSVTCEYPKVIVNRRYAKLSPELRRLHITQPDYYLQVPCGRCSLCKSRIAKEWKVRLTYEFNHTREHRHKGKYLPRVIFFTFTFAEEYYTDSEDIIAPALVKFRDSFRKKYGRSPRYWAITDRGSQFGRLHLHMLLFDPRVYDTKAKEYTRNISITELKKTHFWWSFGFVDAQWVRSFSAAEYVVGYLTGANLYKEEPVKHGKPICEKALRYKPKIFCSKGIGSSQVDSDFVDYVARRDFSTIDLNGFIYALPRYYLNRVTDEIAKKRGLYYKSSAFGHIVVKNFYRDEIIFHRNAVNKAELLDYFARTGFSVDNMRYHYKGKDINYSILQGNIKVSSIFVTPEKERYHSNLLISVESDWSPPPSPDFCGLRYTYYPYRDLHYDFELNYCPF